MSKLNNYNIGYGSLSLQMYTTFLLRDIGEGSALRKVLPDAIKNTDLTKDEIAENFEVAYEANQHILKEITNISNLPKQLLTYDDETQINNEIIPLLNNITDTLVNNSIDAYCEKFGRSEKLPAASQAIPTPKTPVISATEPPKNDKQIKMQDTEQQSEKLPAASQAIPTPKTPVISATEKQIEHLLAEPLANSDALANWVAKTSSNLETPSDVLAKLNETTDRDEISLLQNILTESYSNVPHEIWAQQLKIMINNTKESKDTKLPATEPPKNDKQIKMQDTEQQSLPTQYVYAKVDTELCLL